MKQAFKYRIYPNALQREYFAKCFGCVRFFYNKSLQDKINAYEQEKKTINPTPAQYKEQYEFLKEVDSLALANAQLARETAYKNFFAHRSQFPNFKSKKNDQSYTTNNQGDNVKFSDNNRYITIPKCKRIRIKKHRDFIGTIKSVTVSMTCGCKYYISLLVETNDKVQLEPSKDILGIDLGIKSFLVDSNGKTYKNPKYFAKLEKRLSIEQRKLSHMQKGSKNRNKQRIKVANIHAKINNQRNDFLHKLSTKLIRENQVIAVETLDVKNMEQNKLVAKSVVDASFSRFLTYLDYKAKWHGRTIIKVDKYYASSQTCSNCGFKNEKVKNLSVRSWTCPNCGTKHNRDVNAAKNILSEAIKMLKAGAQPDSLLILESIDSLSKKPPLQGVIA
ncbi:MAG: IS200/IS605 family element RNA-guided endonuclease TnpB [Bacilli bacterium]|nr:IS200/IS605 family element RNA-guided endonuclease TnpB [Bacilli bacterium]